MSEGENVDGPTISPDGKHYWDGQRWVPMPRSRRGHRKGYTISGGTLILLLILGALVFSRGPLQWDCTVQQNGYNMQVEYTGFLAGLKCQNSTPAGFSLVDSHSGSLVCRYPIGPTTAPVWDTGLQILGSSECSNLKAQYDQEHQPSGSSP